MKKQYKKISAMTTDGELYYNEPLDLLESVIENAPYDSCHAADLLALPSGDLLCCWFAGTDEGNADVSIVISRLKKGTKHWSSPVMVSDDSSRSEQNPSLFKTPFGEIWLMYTAQIARTPDDNPRFNLQHTAEIRRKISKDEGLTWGSTETMFSRPGSFCRQKIQVLSSGRWIFGNWICFPDESRNGSDITVMQISDNQGQTWKEVPVPESGGRVHANIIEMEPGTLTALFRSRFADCVYRSESSDNGENWTIPQKIKIRNNNSSISAIKLQSGNIAMIYNDVSFNNDTSRTVWPEQRCPVTIAISSDGGITWPWRRIIENGEGFTGPWNDINNSRYEYPVLMQDNEEFIHGAYTWGTRSNIKYFRIREEWIRGERLCKGAEDNPELLCQR